MPGLSVSPAQAARLWSIDTAFASAALRRLADTGFLRCRADGTYTLTDRTRRACVWFMDP